MGTITVTLQGKTQVGVSIREVYAGSFSKTGVTNVIGTLMNLTNSRESRMELYDLDKKTSTRKFEGEENDNIMLKIHIFHEFLRDLEQRHERKSFEFSKLKIYHST